MSTLRVVEDLRRKKNRQRPSRRKTRKNALIQEPVTSLSSYLDQPDVISEILSSTMPINAQTREDFPSIPVRYSNSASSFPRPLNAITMINSMMIIITTTATVLVLQQIIIIIITKLVHQQIVPHQQ